MDHDNQLLILLIIYSSSIITDYLFVVCVLLVIPVTMMTVESLQPMKS